MKKQKRNIGIECLRVVAMFFVVVMHVCTQGGIVEKVEPFTTNYVITWFFMCVTYCAVNCFALISGYVGVEANYKYYRLLTLWITVFCYTIVITIIFKIVYPETIGIMHFLKAITPATSGQYWYFSAYFALFLFMPFLNYLLNNLSEKQLDVLVLTIVVTFSVLPTIRHTDAFAVEDGYSTLWLMSLYILGEYLKKKQLLYRFGKRRWFMLWSLALLISVASKFLIEYICYKVLGIIAGGGYLLSYISPIVVLEAIALLGFFVQVEMKNSNFIIKLASTTFSVFIIHEHPLIKHQFISERFVNYVELSGIQLVFAIIATAIGIFSICTCIDLVRIQFFRILNVSGKCENLVDKVKTRCF